MNEATRSRHITGYTPTETGVGGLMAYALDHGLTLIDDNNADSFPYGNAVLRGDWEQATEGIEDTDDGYERWWRAVRPFVVELPDDVLAVLVESVTGTEIIRG